VSETFTPVPLQQLSDLYELGQPLPFDLVDPLGRLLLAQGQVIASERQLQALIDRDAGVAPEQVAAVRAARARAGAAAPSAAVRERNLFDRWEEHLWRLDALTRSLAQGAGAAADWQALADDHVAVVDRQPEVALFLVVRQDDRRFALYGLTHALHVATVALLTGRMLGWAPEAVRAVVRAALTMNAPICELQSRMAQQTDPPTRRQLDAIRAHPATATAWLRRVGVADDGWLQAVDEHHEQPGGGGYPQGLAAPGDAARLLRVCDVLTAKITPRALRAALLPQVAARQLFQQEGGGPMAGALIKAIGIYPPGDLVLLRSGEVAVVAQRPSPPQGALAVVLLTAQGRPAAGLLRRDTGTPEFAVAGPAPDRAKLPRVLPEQVYGVLPP
jgi:HD-GYP domain-containing protein (c-di-GMP phosphodiesterase class II)